MAAPPTSRNRPARFTNRIFAAVSRGAPTPISRERVSCALRQNHCGQLVLGVPDASFADRIRLNKLFQHHKQDTKRGSGTAATVAQPIHRLNAVSL